MIGVKMQKSGVSVGRIIDNIKTEVVVLEKSVGHNQAPEIYGQVKESFTSNSSSTMSYTGASARE
jgi:hypothetical protein